MMDQIKIGKFIQSVRKERGFTQSKLAEALGISDKTVSKWETGSGLPEVGFMMPLCGLLGITVNELLSGERLDHNSYQKRAEENMIDLIREKKSAKETMILCVIIAAITVLAGVTLAVVSGLFEMPVWVRVLLIVIAVTVVAGGIAVDCVLDKRAGVYECPHCGERFVPSTRAFIGGLHGFTWRRLKCPKCGKKGNCKKRLSRAK